MSEKLPIKGILGLGKASTLYYLNEIQERYQRKNDLYSTCPFILYQVDFQEINPFLPNNFSILIPKLEYFFHQIKELGISKLLVPNITLHESIDQVSFQFDICHPVFLTLKYLAENKISEVCLFGTKYTMNSEYLHHKFSEKNIKMYLPSKEDQDWIDHFRKSVYSQKSSSEETLKFQQLIRKYSSKSAVIISCTELSLFSLKNDSSCIDMADLQIEEFLR
ncbi:aspartate/glutamate racemase family protein [Kaistella antarctica]|uniref:Putative racemase n=1 Tax=Kaistella antarctica TaxID=266748 RepID=A0A448NT65_9FLAO|nr:aspartate/glutamate racemase family protein [Kaistella antarctica]KEY18045.1 hypothetical protein HY04_05835 [Kaistella antarctica]SEV82317.1 aspartate racemase [Kaistella antarctica]VEI00580.1 putative racemase [Kaistella antarctica]